MNPIGIVAESRHPGAAVASLTEALRGGGILTGVPGADKDSVLRTIIDKLPLHDGADREGLLQLLLAREKAGSTAVGNGIAIPHSRYPVVLPVGQPLLTLCYLEQPIAFGSGALGQVDTLFVLVTPTIAVHLQLFARLAAMVQDDTVKRLLKQRCQHDDILREALRIERQTDGSPDRKRAD